MSKTIILTAHARLRMAERKLPLAWIERTARHPDWVEPEPLAPSVERRFRDRRIWRSHPSRCLCRDRFRDPDYNSHVRS
ncbi:MAG: DUF4258 domain-containing protein [Tardiphaga sp.]